MFFEQHPVLWILWSTMGYLMVGYLCSLFVYNNIKKITGAQMWWTTILFPITAIVIGVWTAIVIIRFSAHSAIQGIRDTFPKKKQPQLEITPEIEDGLKEIEKMLQE